MHELRAGDVPGAVLRLAPGLGLREIVPDVQDDERRVVEARGEIGRGNQRRVHVGGRNSVRGDARMPLPLSVISGVSTSRLRLSSRVAMARRSHGIPAEESVTLPRHFVRGDVSTSR